MQMHVMEKRPRIGVEKNREKRSKVQTEEELSCAALKYSRSWHVSGRALARTCVSAMIYTVRGFRT